MRHGRLSGMAITLRRVGVGDAQSVARLLGQLGHPTDVPRARLRIGEWMADERSVLTVAEVDGAVSGLAALHVMPPLDRDECRGRLLALVVDSSSRRQGIGRMLVADAENEARRLGCRDLEITSARSRVAAQLFYGNIGYRDACETAARFVKPLL